jgi:hypothetical protein
MGVTASEPSGGNDVQHPRGVDIRFEILSLDPIISRHQLDLPPFNEAHWSNATAAARIPAHVTERLEKLITNTRPPRVSGFEVIDVEAHATDSGTVPSREPTVFQRLEGALVARFVQFKSKQGIVLRSIRFQPLNWLGALRCDLYDADKSMLIEAKANCDRESIRLAIGQLADYRRLYGQPCRTAVLLPYRPHPDLIDLMNSQQVLPIWEDGDTFKEGE